MMLRRCRDALACLTTRLRARARVHRSATLGVRIQLPHTRRRTPGGSPSIQTARDCCCDTMLAWRSRSMSNESRQHTGACSCGDVRYILSGPPRWVAHCHCVDCRRATGGTFTTYAGYNDSRVVFESGEPTYFATSEGVTRGFCGRCGSSLVYASTRWPGELHILVASLDEPRDMVPTLHVYVKDRLSWHVIGDDLPQYQGVASDEA